MVHRSRRSLVVVGSASSSSLYLDREPFFYIYHNRPLKVQDPDLIVIYDHAPRTRYRLAFASVAVFIERETFRFVQHFLANQPHSTQPNQILISPQ